MITVKMYTMYILTVVTVIIAATSTVSTFGSCQEEITLVGTIA